MQKFKQLIAIAILVLFGAFLRSHPASVLAAGTNLIANPSVETASGALPTSWAQDKWGTNTTAFTYKTTEGNTGSKSLYLNMTKRTSGDAKWYFTSVTVKPNQKYTYTEVYKSNVASEIDVEYTTTLNKLGYLSLGTPVASATSWKTVSYTFTTPASVKSLTIFHVMNKVGWLQNDDFSLVEGDGTVVTPPPAPTAPTVSITSPLNNSTVAGTQAINATATDAVGVLGVQFKIDNVNFGAEDTTAPYSTSVDTKTLTNAGHTISAVARNAAALTATATSNVTVKNPTPPSVVLTSPTGTVSGTQTINATATDAVGVLGVQFKIDNVNFGAEDTTAPFSTSWNTTLVANGNHTVSAVARNAAALTATATATVNVQNIVVLPPPNSGTNLIKNPSFETASGTAPSDWLASNWGSNTSTFTYLSTGHTGGHSARVDVTNFTDGAANWYYADIPVTSGKTYKYENWYQSNVDTEVDAEILMSDGSIQYAWLGTVFAGTTWTKFTTTFTVPTGAKGLAIYQILAKNGYIISDDYSLSEYTPLPLNRGLVSVTFDDGWTNQYTNALPLLQKYGLNATFYIISNEIGDQPDYMSATQIKNLKAAGMEIGSHSVTHSDMVTLSQANIVAEMANSKTTLQNLIGSPVTDFAYPYGSYNASTIAVGSQYYQSQRSVNGGLNTKDNFNITTLKIYEVDSNISVTQVKGWIDAAIAQKAWLILVFHEVATSPVDPTDALYTSLPSDVDAELGYIKSTGVTTLTVNQALNEILPQL